MAECFVKAKPPQSKSFMFVTSRGGLNRLRIFAAIFRDEQTAQATIDMNAPSRPDWKWKVVPA